MRAILTTKQNELLLFIDQSIRETGISPSFEEMREGISLQSKSGVHRLLQCLEERGFVRRLPNRARALEVLRMPPAASSAQRIMTPDAANDTVSIPLYGRIAAGVPIEAIAGLSQLAVPSALLGTGEHYALEVSGSSMVDAGILDGDYALIRRTAKADEGKIVVALIDETEATLKYFRQEGSMIRLDPANRAYDPQRYDRSRVRIQGCLTGIMRHYA